MTQPPARQFLGYRRASGRPGVRNFLLVLNITGLTMVAARRVAAELTGSRLVTMDHGTTISGRNDGPVNATLEALALHPNVGAVLVLSALRGKAEALAARLSDSGRPVAAVSLDDTGRDAHAFRTAAVQTGARLIVEMSRQRREPFGWHELMIALECGMSDPTSGLAANPLLGHLTDRLIDAGGAAVFGETTEWLGCEHHLMQRAATPAIAARIGQAVARRVALAGEAGLDLLGNNPNAVNIASGLTTIEDKAIGSVAKSGQRPITAFLEYGERLAGPGLAAQDGPSYTPESLTGLVAAGAQVVLFTTGCGNAYVSRMAPTIKITGNAATADSLPAQFDFCCADALRHPDRMAASVDALQERLLEVASGALTFGEILGEDEEVISRFGETL